MLKSERGGIGSVIILDILMELRKKEEGNAAALTLDRLYSI